MIIALPQLPADQYRSIICTTCFLATPYGFPPCCIASLDLLFIVRNGLNTQALCILNIFFNCRPDLLPMKAKLVILPPWLSIFFTILGQWHVVVNGTGNGNDFIPVSQSVL